MIHEIIATDQGFLRLMGRLLTAMGILSLLLGSLCYLWPDLGLCASEWIPVLSGLEGIGMQFTHFTLPMCMLLCGLGLLARSTTAWLLLVMLLAMTAGVLAMLVWFNASLLMAGIGTAAVGAYLAVNTGLVLLCISGIAYLSTRPLRKIFGMMQ